MPAASADDGLLDVVVVAPRTLRDWLRIDARIEPGALIVRVPRSTAAAA